MIKIAAIIVIALIALEAFGVTNLGWPIILIVVPGIEIFCITQIVVIAGKYFPESKLGQEVWDEF